MKEYEEQDRHEERSKKGMKPRKSLASIALSKSIRSYALREPEAVSAV